MKESWKTTQVAIMGIIGILLIFVLIAVKLNVNTDNFTGKAYADYKLYDADFVGEKCDFDFYDPVCGENRVTYNNACVAITDGVPVAYQGICH